MTKYCTILSLVATFLLTMGASQLALANDTPVFNITPTQEQKNIILARTTFLPDHDENSVNEGYEFDDDYNYENCSDYPLLSCPANAECETCPSDYSKLNIKKCKTGYYLSDEECLPSNCAVLGYEDSIPEGKMCTLIQKEELNCYKNCQDINCSGYTLDCDTKLPHVEELVQCPNCKNKNTNCSNKFCKISKCKIGYKIATNGTECIALNDSCPSDYYKECKNGIDENFVPELTEAGSKCYKCKTATCPAGQIDLDTYWCNGALKCFLPSK